ncbi:dynein regulatory complex subunit 7 isoform X1 [Eleutherodactylus coqui]|uniref:dynein regulatory complex subunit 7 isoform X1 n=1 Tax=Eleutherodactylus coqui TaxID=57060 RepID=UPI0034637B63
MEALEEVDERGHEEEEEVLGDDEMRHIQEQLAVIEVMDPSRDIINGAAEERRLPSSYSQNSPKEQLLLSLAKNFCRQYAHLYQDREPLLTAPLNECGVEKFVCSTLCPTLLPYPDVYHWEGAAQFVSSCLTMQPLKPEFKLPRRLFSSFSVLRNQKGNCFDFSVLLCSLLLGAGYDAYCVSGYATQEMCLMDETREPCPLLTTTQESLGASAEKPRRKYSVRPPRQLVSKFELQQKAKKEAKVPPSHLKQHEEDERRLAETADTLYGRRVHCWVLVLAGKREVPDHFFIDALTGKAYETKDQHFLGIESLWNHENYWANMQDCRKGCKDLTFDLGDPFCWEFMLLSMVKPALLIPDMNEEEDDDEEQNGDQDRAMQMPVSWVLPIVMTPKEFETRYPQGKKLLKYKKAELEKWAPYLRGDGQVSRLTQYQDTECSKELEVQVSGKRCKQDQSGPPQSPAAGDKEKTPHTEDWFQNREDKLDRRQKSQFGVITEYFSPGRADALKVHTFCSRAPETERTMLFYSEARLDGLQRLEEQPKEMLEIFQGRQDLLHYRHTLYGQRPKKVSIAGGPIEANPRPILKITERFHRNTDKPANEDVAERIFLITEDRIHVRCHRLDDHITTSTWEFLKPPNLGKKGTNVLLSPETCISYQVEPLGKFNTQLYVYETLIQLQQGEQSAQEAVRRSEAEVLAILSRRAQEEGDPQLTISIYDTERNERSKEQRALQERARQEERQRRAALELDYLAPYLTLLGDPEKVTRLQAQQVKEDCLRDLKNRLIQQANLIQARFEKETQELQKKQQWYQENQPSMDKKDEEAYLEFCSEAMFRIQILETRLNRHKELAPQKYLTLEDRLSKDPRLCEPLLSL